MVRAVRPIDSGEPEAALREERDTADRELVVAIRAGDRSAFDRLYRRHAPTVARRLRRILGRKEDVEDVLQQTFMEMHRSLDRFDSSRAFAPWLHGISIRVTGTFLRTHKRRWWQVGRDDVETVPSAIAPESSPEANAVVDQAAALIWHEVALLPPDKRIAFTLFELEQRTVGEVAELMSTSPQTAWARIQSARERIAKKLAKTQGDV